MSKTIKWAEGHIEVAPPKRPKKITGTRFANIMGLSPYKTPFATWCEITKTYEEPFEDTIYTIAGKTIEPKQAEFARMFSLGNFLTPTEAFGEDYFNRTRGDFFPENPVLGGMWDYLDTDEDGHPEAVYEMKTTKRPEDWEDDIPEYYALQAALYAHLLGVDQVIMVCSILDERKDYAHPEDYVPSLENTLIKPFKVSERYPNMAELVQYAYDWWDEHVKSGVSPDYDEKKDAEIIKALRTNTVDDDAPIEDLITEAEKIKAEIEALQSTIAKDVSAAEKKLKTVQEKIKAYAKDRFADGIDEILIHGPALDWKYTRSYSMKVDEDRLKADGLFDKYAAPSESYRLTCSKRKD